MQLGFVIDQSRCIGCHACTVACKSENGVPLGSFRTWVKYTEEGVFPDVRRGFTVLRCNQCTQAPCVTICPVRALEKRPDGVVDVDPGACIGCKACMQGCPYDALYMNEDSGTAEKCHFCVHRTEMGLAPACAVVCPTEAIIPGDFDDPSSGVARMRAQGDLAARKVEAGTGPNVLYRAAAAAGIDPLRTRRDGGFLWADHRPGCEVPVEEQDLLERRASARTVYDVERPALWGRSITGYLYAKSLAAGTSMAALLAGLFSGEAAHPDLGSPGVPLLGLLLLALTTALLILDLGRPARFFYILTRPNWSSWLTRGTWALIGYGALLAVWLAMAVLGASPGGASAWMLALPVLAAAGLGAGYTGWLFAQAKGRVLWMRRGLWLQLIVQAAVAGNALLLLLGPAVGLRPPVGASLRLALMAWLVLHLAGLLLESRLAPRGREPEYRRVLRRLRSGLLRRWHDLARIGGVALPLALLALAQWSPAPVWLAVPAALLVLVGLWLEDDILVKAGQALPIS